MSNSPGNELTLETTEDGSHTLYSGRYKQHYHNPNGAVAESRHVFYQSTDLVDSLQKNKPIQVLEVGFGTGLNLALLIDTYFSNQSESQLVYHSVEAHPVSPAIARQFNYDTFLSHPGITEKIAGMFNSISPGQNSFHLYPGVEARIFNGLFQEYSPDSLKADYIFHDPFSPDVNPELWSGEVFKKLLTHSSSKAMLTTYGAASEARGAMAWAGWHVARREGALGKREMTVASPDPGRIAHLSGVNEQRLAQRYEEGDFQHSGNMPAH